MWIKKQIADWSITKLQAPVAIKIWWSFHQNDLKAFTMCWNSLIMMSMFTRVMNTVSKNMAMMIRWRRMRKMFYSSYTGRVNLAKSWQQVTSLSREENGPWYHFWNAATGIQSAPASSSTGLLFFILTEIKLKISLNLWLLILLLFKSLYFIKAINSTLSCYI